jgi:drug/metabolite transporter (DMT)-like permease
MNTSIVLVIFLVLANNLITVGKRKFLKECGRSFSPMVYAFIVEFILLIFLTIYVCTYNTEQHLEDIQFVLGNNKFYLVVLVGFICFVSAWLHYTIISNYNISELSLLRNCLSIILMLIISHFVLHESVDQPMIIGVFYLFLSMYFISLSKNSADV